MLFWENLFLIQTWHYQGLHSHRLRAAHIFSQFVEREAKKKNDCAKIGDEASGSDGRKIFSPFACMNTKEC